MILSENDQNNCSCCCDCGVRCYLVCPPPLLLLHTRCPRPLLHADQRLLLTFGLKTVNTQEQFVDPSITAEMRTPAARTCTQL